MPDNSELESFLGATEEQAPSPEPIAPEAPPAEPKPEPQQPDPKAETPQEPEPEEEDEPGRLVPLKAVHDERRKRDDWKEKATRYETEARMLREQLEAAQKAPPPAPVQVQVPSAPQQPSPVPEPPNPATDPAGYAKWLDDIQFNGRLNLSERAIRGEMGDAEVNAKIALFQQAAQANPSLAAAIRLHPDPYRFAYEQGAKVEKQREEQTRRDAMLQEIGTDPAAYREKLKAELLAEMQAATPPAKPAPAAPQFQSLAHSRSVQARTAPGALVSDVPLEEIFPQK